MGTNYYLRRNQPTIHESIHVGKQSWGWRMHWDSLDEPDWPRWCDTDHVPPYPELPHSIHSVEDIRSYLRTGEWELVDEYGYAYEDWEGKLGELCDWDGGKAGWNASHPDKPVEWEACVPSGFRDHEGQVFDSGNGFV